MSVEQAYQYPNVIAEICGLHWPELSSEDMACATWAYYYFSIKFRESLRAARSLYPADEKLIQLEREECETANLSPWPGVAQPGETMNHDEFMRRALTLCPMEPARARELAGLGDAYLAATRAVSIQGQAASIASYEDGGLENVFTAMLTFSRWDNPMLQAFQHFLSEHIRFDSNPDAGHGALSRHIKVDDSVLPLWQAFRDILVAAAPKLQVQRLQVAAE